MTSRPNHFSWTAAGNLKRYSAALNFVCLPCHVCAVAVCLFLVRVIYYLLISVKVYHVAYPASADAEYVTIKDIVVHAVKIESFVKVPNQHQT